ncbi:MAG: septum formation initiator family protein [Actinomycetota bacterium]
MSGTATLDPPDQDDGPSSSPRRRWTRFALPIAVTIVLLTVLVVAVFPTRQLLDQRAQVNDARDRLGELDTELETVEERASTLRDPDAVELMARDEFLLARPGDELYVLRPPVRAEAEFPNGWPFPGFEHLVNGG